jgi:hypothetical protein
MTAKNTLSFKQWKATRNFAPPKKLAIKFVEYCGDFRWLFWSMRPMSDVDLPLFDSSITRRGRAWRWCVSGEAGEIVLQGMERSRPAAQYMAARATFLLLLTAPYWRRTNSAELGATALGLRR